MQNPSTAIPDMSTVPAPAKPSLAGNCTEATGVERSTMKAPDPSEASTLVAASRARENTPYWQPLSQLLVKPIDHMGAEKAGLKLGGLGSTPVTQVVPFHHDATPAPHCFDRFRSTWSTPAPVPVLATSV